MPATTPVSGFSSDYLTIDYRPDLHLLTLRWLRDVTFSELQAGFQAAHAAARTAGATRWLIDVRRRLEMDAVPSTWVANQLLPVVAAELPGTLQVAYLLAPARHEAIQTVPNLKNAVLQAQAPSQPYRLQVFIDEGEAVRWACSL
ncbi:hypothetical protein PK28_09860 [Hymenobacter sp. DG25B]|jgi:hypothetical protein|uniref:hypothetical protein n=1 Tax=Hymenobacter sp. DG25B TaxID=1385664 RepID=UPI000541332C|nr:hypothetical protein [Hymenobacter sp. DG25B]AIZ63913.1 hypothetical protein PK28_09860 [Hymenobacter sp. DG25B]